MKTMNFLVLFTMIFSLNSCSVEESQTTDNLSNVQQAQFENEEGDQYFEASFHQYYLEAEHYDLTEEKAQLLEGIEAGNDELLKRLEEVQKELAKNEESQESLVEYFGGIIPRLPTPPPGNPCGEPKRTHCPVPGIRSFNLLSAEENGDLFIKLSTEEGEVYNEINEPQDEIDGRPAYRIEMEGDMIKMEITKPFEVTGGETNYFIYLQLF